ncbi:hypothetical protein L198_07729 [Cryptococcus wingfieldii CBS 7118]|uniref:Uncharacterized protein n=1 Tax=Cryptococcus wingfieldii CBS 7118 TaxID=1295528 RepID=A0A1E3I1X8_9TREE|nr:hypothetical protein L198_07729 [Cryptococcus wingfieldii CBS 7118]ODN82507.1 hypothetical protein L198_07729 [Cryptococcus wingfieldii CBS 7118]
MEYVLRRRVLQRGSGHLEDRVQWPINTRGYYLWMAKYGVTQPYDVMSLAYFSSKNRDIKTEGGSDYANQWTEKVAEWIREYNRLCRPWMNHPSFRSSDPSLLCRRWV